ncbi:RNA polymerase sigma-70 factor [Sphingobacterium haloxyli]|uniref:RNA polymerase sigma-70 factor n=1 Tax=Sphingobacterium haloxyli TaxID=2100533 RepID=UPI001056E497|nr:RNA polymerase sigma-70 factor [Sphingobacterium haloxyli]
MNYSKASDNELFACCQKDDMRAYNQLFDRFVGKLHRMGLRYIKDEYAVEELVTDILLNLWIRRNEITLEGQLSPYLFRAMHNRAISFLRKATPETIDINTLSGDKLVADGTADQQIGVKEALKTYEERLARLSPQRQKVFRLSREEDMSYADIAIEMNLSPNTVKNHMNAALEYLRMQYGDATVSTVLLFSLFLY